MSCSHLSLRYLESRIYNWDHYCLLLANTNVGTGALYEDHIKGLLAQELHVSLHQPNMILYVAGFSFCQPACVNCDDHVKKHLKNECWCWQPWNLELLEGGGRHTDLHVMCKVNTGNNTGDRDDGLITVWCQYSLGYFVWCLKMFFNSIFLFGPWWKCKLKHSLIQLLWFNTVWIKKFKGLKGAGLCATLLLQPWNNPNENSLKTTGPLYLAVAAVLGVPGAGR